MNENELRYHLGLTQYSWMEPANRRRVERNMQITNENKREKIIEWMRRSAFPILPDSLECIHREDWDLEALNGVSEEALNHPHYDIWWDYIYKNHKPRHKVLLVFECSNKKPYFASAPHRYYINRYNEFCDFASIDYGIQPWEFVNMYPSRWDEWDHYKETPHMQYLYSEKTKQRILEYHRRFPQYEKMIFYCQNKHPQRPVDELWEANTDNFRDWAIIVSNDEYHEGLLPANPSFKNNPGMLVKRALNLRYTYNHIVNALLSCYDDPETKERIIAMRDAKHVKSIHPFRREIAIKAYEEGIHPWNEEFLNKLKNDAKQKRNH